MANTREIVKRRKSVSNICKITRTMEMISTSRFKKAHDRSVGARPYTQAIGDLVATLASGDSSQSHPLLQNNDDVKKMVLLVLTSNRGLCGGYNGNVLRMAVREVQKLKEQGYEVDLRVSGKKGSAYFKFLKLPVSCSYSHFDDKTTYLDVETLANEYIDMYVNKEIAGVKVVYTNFISASRFNPEVLDLLPLSSLDKKDEDLEADTPKASLDDYIFSPSANEILQNLIPTTVRTRLFQCFIDAIVSEQVSRMRSMKAATDNADQMIKALTRQYNRARQSQITGELLDILGGVGALQ